MLCPEMCNVNGLIRYPTSGGWKTTVRNAHQRPGSLVRANPRWLIVHRFLAEIQVFLRFAVHWGLTGQFLKVTLLTFNSIVNHT